MPDTVLGSYSHEQTNSRKLQITEEAKKKKKSTSHQSHEVTSSDCNGCSERRKQELGGLQVGFDFRRWPGKASKGRVWVTGRSIRLKDQQGKRPEVYLLIATFGVAIQGVRDKALEELARVQIGDQVKVLFFFLRQSH